MFAFTWVRMRRCNACYAVGGKITMDRAGAAFRKGWYLPPGRASQISFPPMPARLGNSSARFPVRVSDRHFREIEIAWVDKSTHATPIGSVWEGHMCVDPVHLPCDRRYTR